jgi:hypothetical protein
LSRQKKPKNINFSILYIFNLNINVNYYITNLNIKIVHDRIYQQLKGAAMARVKYTNNHRKKVVAYIQDYDAKNKRGGMAQAQKKYKIAYPTLKVWLAGGSAKAAPKAGKTKTAKSASPAVRNAIMSRLDKVLDYERQIGALRELVEKEKAAIRAMLS